MAIEVGSIEEAVADMKKRGAAALRSAVSKAANVAAQDIYNHSISCIDEYYASYTPLIYVRTHQLYQTPSQLIRVSENGNTIMAEFGVEFIASAMGPHKYRTFWGTREGDDIDNQDAVLSHFLGGIHPNTGVQTSPSADASLIQYLERYEAKMNQLIDSYFSLSM